MTLKSIKIDVMGVCNFLGSVSSQQKFEARGQLLEGPGLQLRVTAQFYSENKGKYILEVCRPKRHGEKRERENTRAKESVWEWESDSERPWPFGSSFYVFFLLPLGLPCVNWARQERCLFHLRFSLWSSDLPLFYFHELFSSLSFSHHHSGLLFLF